jgi:hypothetical protein
MNIGSNPCVKLLRRRLRGELEVAALRRALHKVLRTRYVTVDGELGQLVWAVTWTTP